MHGKNIHNSSSLTKMNAKIQIILLPQLGRRSLNYFHSLRNDMFFSVSFFITFATAISKSSCVTWTLLSRRANIPASVQTACTSAPEAPFIFSAIFFRSIPRIKFIFLEWIFKISHRDSSLGFGNSIFLSILPGLRRA
nr:unnamed protein product [Ipomoea batatas]